MSDTETTLIALRLRERELELDACAVKARIEEIRELIAMLERPRRGRPRNVSAINPVVGPLPEPEPDTAA